MAALYLVGPLMFSIFFVISNGAINIDEINSISYHVDILNRPVLGVQEASASIMYMTSKYGQEYQCQLPEVPKFQEDGKIIDESATVSPQSDISSLLKPLETRPCLIKTKDWWTYEFCYGKYIKQYHLEDNKIASPVILLGIYESEFNWKNGSMESENSKNRQQRYHSQFYVNGSKCDVTGTLRKSEVRFVCEEGAGDYIAQLDEPESCHYIIMINTNKICHHPYLRPLPTNKPRLIMCNPILTSEQYEVYQKREEEESKKMEERQKKWLAKQEEELLAFKQQDDDSAKNGNTQIAEETPVALLDETTAESFEQSKSSHTENTIGSLFPAKDVGEEDDDGETELVQSDEGQAVEFQEISKLSKLSKKLATLEKFLDTELKGQVARWVKESKENPSSLDLGTFYKLIQTLKSFLNQLDKAGKDILTVDEALSELQKTFLQHYDNLAEESEATQGKSDEVVTQKEGLQMEPVIEEKDDDALLQVSNSLKLNAGKFLPEILKALKLKNKNKLKSVDSTTEESDSDQNVAIDDENVVSLEKEVMDRLKQMGIDTEGRKVEVKIITAGYFDNYEEYHGINVDDTSRLKTVVVKLLGGNNEATAKQARHQHSLEKNYKFVWDENSPSTGEDDEENNEYDNYKNA